MKTTLLIAGTATLLFAGLMAAEGQGIGLYRSGEYSVDLFASGSIGQQTINSLSGSRIRHDLRLGVGAGVSYYLTRNVGIEAEAYSENPRGSIVDDTSVNLLLRFPLGKTGLAPYGIAGVGRQIDPSHYWHGQLGAGLEYRLRANLGIFFDGRYVMGDGGRNYGLGRGGLRFTF